MHASTTVTIDGAVHGNLWWPDAPAQHPIRHTVTIGRNLLGAPTARRTLREIAEAAVDSVGADFRDGGNLTGDSFVTIERTYVTHCLGMVNRSIRKASRTYMAAELPSMADYVLADVVTMWPEDFDGAEEVAE